MAVLGGVLLVVVLALTTGSVIGRTAANSPLLGDSEIVELGVAAAIFAFMPYCQIRGANVLVDFFTMGARPRTRALLDTVMNAVFLVCVAILTWRLAVGGIQAYRGGDNSMFLRLPLWWGYLVGFLGSVVWVLTCIHAVLRHAGNWLNGGGTDAGRGW
jgi:TRAP-type C4-dicarboxylate transport system permease small subunit